MQLSNWSIYMRDFSSFGAEIKKLLASKKCDQFPVGPCRAVPGCAVPCRAGPGRAGSRTLIEYPIHLNETSLTSSVVNITYVLPKFFLFKNKFLYSGYWNPAKWQDRENELLKLIIST